MSNEPKFKLLESVARLEWVWTWKYPFLIKVDVIQVYVLLAGTGQCCHIFKMKPRGGN